jgi:ankyrin repeat protein
MDSFVVDWSNSRGMTALHTAAMRGELEAAQILIENGADINAPDLHGNSPLHYALSYGKLPVVKLLVELDCETDLKNNQGFSASDFAYSFSCADALKVVSTYIYH